MPKKITTPWLPQLHDSELAWLRDVAGKKVAVLGSGDNQVVFALAGMGAVVTSIDISQQLIEIALTRRCSWLAGGLRPGRRGRPVGPRRRGFRHRLYGWPCRGLGFRLAPVLRRSCAHLETGRPPDRQRISSVSSRVAAFGGSPRSAFQLLRPWTTSIQGRPGYTVQGARRTGAVHLSLDRRRLHRRNPSVRMQAYSHRRIWRYMRGMGRSTDDGLTGVAASGRTAALPVRANRKQRSRPQCIRGSDNTGTPASSY